MTFKSTLSLLFFLISTSASASDTLIFDTLMKHSFNAYNRLPLSAAAHLKLNRNGNIERLLEEVLPIAKKCELSGKIGFRLAHQHHPISEGEVMVESFKYWKSTPAFITSVKKQKSTVGILPASWLETPSGLKVFEFSDDLEVKKVLDILIEHPERYNEISKVCDRYGLKEILAFAIIDRSAFKYFNSQPLYEMINPNPYASVLVNKSQEDIQEMSGLLVRTSWLIGNPQHDVECVTYCHASDEDYKFHQYTH